MFKEKIIVIYNVKVLNNNQILNKKIYFIFNHKNKFISLALVKSDNQIKSQNFNIYLPIFFIIT